MSLRTRILATSCAFLSLVCGIGWMAQTENAKLGAFAVGIYDNAVRGMSFATDAQIGLLNLRASYKGGALDDASTALLQAMQDKLDVARQLAITPRTGQIAANARVAVANIMAHPGVPALDAADTAARKLVNRFSADALDVRDNAEALAKSSKRIVLGAIGAAAIAAALLGWLLLRAVMPPIRRAVAIATAIAEGKLDNTIDTRGTQEAAQLLAALARMQEAIAGNLAQLEARHEREKAESVRAAARSAKLAATTERFESDVSLALESLSLAATGLRGASHEMSGAAEDANARATAVAQAAGETADVVTRVAAATEELAASIREVGARVDQSTQIVGMAVTQARDSDQTVQGLTGAAQKIGAIVDVIRTIASQTNLLALNATIEAARAGDAGRGFAVVANEVKTLANQTAHATDEIAAQIRTMQAETANAAEAIRSIATTIDEVNTLSLAIATSMDQQGAATAEIARNIATAATGTDHVSGNIDSVTHAAGQVHASAGQVLTASTGLSEQSDRLREGVRRFLDEVRAA
jgi:methyl-accepting chemotaxis protein